MSSGRNLALACIPIAICIACVNPYTKFYHDRTNGQPLDPKYWQTCDEPIDVFQGNDPQQDADSLREDGFEILGYSNYNGSQNAGRDAFMEQARKVKACRVIFYDPKHTGTTTGSISTYVPINKFSVAVTTPIITERYDYLVTYWIKERPESIKLGLQCRDLNSEERSMIGSNRGIKVNIVMRNTPAFRADILKGDIVRSMGGKSVDDMKTFQLLLTEFAGKSIDIVVFRGGSERTIQVLLNAGV